ncbi:unnamed protein product [Rotaria magnacalcarata]|uniref:Uncharacterized protein n=1 Tax=Rotaria magnacalcarata TaxID=392030 RepID=A0A816PHA8_9BILA|nr:unnamed protein product [Rotaria magnacalcarata]
MVILKRMALVKSIYRLKIHHFFILSFFFITCSIIGFNLKQYFEEYFIDFSEYDDKITIWSNDYHISPINDLKHLLTPLGVRFIDEKWVINIVAGNNLYDAEYIRYFTGINTIVLPSICDYINVVYNPSDTHREYIFAPSSLSVEYNKEFLDELNFSIKRFNASIIVKPLRQLYRFYRYENLVRHPAIIYLPYQVSIMSIFEQYSMNIPLFFPSLDLLTDLHVKYCVVRERTWDTTLSGTIRNSSTIPSYYTNVTIPDPNNEVDYSAIRYWLKYADFYQWPHITYFNSIDDLTSKLMQTNLTFISERMLEYNHKKKFELLQHWKIILNRLSTSSFFLRKKTISNRKQK